MKIPFAVGMTSPHRTMNRVPQCVHAATPNRSTAPGGAPQFGQLISRGGSRPAGTIGCWIGGGGGGVARRDAFELSKAINVSTLRKAIPGTIEDHSDEPGFSTAASPRRTKSKTKKTKDKTINTTGHGRRVFVRGCFHGDDGGYGLCTEVGFEKVLDERSHGLPDMINGLSTLGVELE